MPHLSLIHIYIVIVDTGNSYQGLCSLIRQKTKGRDGIYFTYQEDAPVAFNPFFVEDGVYGGFNVYVFFSTSVDTSGKVRVIVFA